MQTRSVFDGVVKGKRNVIWNTNLAVSSLESESNQRTSGNGMWSTAVFGAEPKPVLKDEGTRLAEPVFDLTAFLSLQMSILLL